MIELKFTSLLLKNGSFVSNYRKRDVMSGIWIFILMFLIMFMSVGIVFINPFGKSKSLFAVIPAVLGVILHLSRKGLFPSADGIWETTLKTTPFVFVVITLLLVFKIQLSHNRPS